MCPKDFVSNRNTNNFFEEASPLRDKLEFNGMQISERRMQNRKLRSGFRRSL